MTEDRLAPPTFDPADAAAAAARFAATAPADVHYALVDSPVGTLVAAATPRGLAALSYEDHSGGADAVLDWLSAKLSPRMLEAPARLDDVRRELDEYFEGRRRDFDLPIDWTLTSPFGRRVLKATAAIPFGRVSTYGEMAAQGRQPQGLTRRRPRARRQPDPHRRALPSRDRRERPAHRLHRRAATARWRCWRSRGSSWRARPWRRPPAARTGPRSRRDPRSRPGPRRPRPTPPRGPRRRGPRASGAGRRSSPARGAGSRRPSGRRSGASTRTHLDRAEAGGSQRAGEHAGGAEAERAGLTRDRRAEPGATADDAHRHAEEAVAVGRGEDDRGQPPAGSAARGARSPARRAARAGT